MLIAILPVEQNSSTRRIPSFELILHMILATLLAPLAAPASVVIAISLMSGDVRGGLHMLAYLPVAIFTVPGIYGYVVAFVAVAVLGTGLTLLALHLPRLRPGWIWAATGALFGILIALALGTFGAASILCGAAAGGSCAFVYRLIVARPLAAHRFGSSALDCPKPEAVLD